MLDNVQKVLYFRKATDLSFYGRVSMLIIRFTAQFIPEIFINEDERIGEVESERALK